MAFLNKEQLEREIEERELIRPWEREQVEQGKYELAVAREYYHTAMEGGKKVADGQSQIVIPPGQLALLITHETVKIPLDRMGFISMKFGNKMRGLINVSGFHVDPGFRGKLKFSVYNAGSRDAIIDPLRPLFQIWISTLTNSEDEDTAYKGSHSDQKTIDDNDVDKLQGKVASPGTLLKEIEDVRAAVHRDIEGFRSEMRLYKWLGGIALTLFLVVILIPIAKWASEYWVGNNSNEIRRAASDPVNGSDAKN